MVRTQIQLDEPTYNALRRLAHRRHVSMSSVLREILHDHLSISKDREAAQYSFVGAGGSGHRDTSVRHDEVLSETYQ